VACLKGTSETLITVGRLNFSHLRLAKTLTDRQAAAHIVRMKDGRMFLRPSVLFGGA
jgi:hypothetical protein